MNDIYLKGLMLTAKQLIEEGMIKSATDVHKYFSLEESVLLIDFFVNTIPLRHIDGLYHTINNNTCL